MKSRLVPMFFAAACAALLPVSGAAAAAGCGSGLKAKAPGVKRVFVFGGAQAALITASAVPGLELIYCGGGDDGVAASAEQLAGAARYGADLAVVAAGAPRSYDGGWLLKKYYALRYRGGALRAERLRALESGLAGVKAAARRAGVPLVLATLPFNLQAQPAGILPPEDLVFAGGTFALARRDPATAAELFRKELAAGRGGALTRFWLARALGASGDAAGARENFLRAMDEDRWGARPTTAENAAVRRAASDGAFLCDLERAFVAVSSNGITGFAEFSGPLRWRPAYAALVWRELAASAAKAGVTLPAGPRYSPPGAFREAEARNEAADVAASLRGREAAGLPFYSEEALSRLALLAARGADPAVPGLKGGELGVFLAHKAEALRRLGELPAALAAADKATALLPGEPEPALTRAVCLLASGKAAGEKELARFYFRPAQRARAVAAASAYGLLKPGAALPAPAPAGAAASARLADEAVKKIFAGDKAAAFKELDAALKLNPLNAEALMDLCSLKAGAGASDEALAACAAVPGAAGASSAVYAGDLAADALYARVGILLGLGRAEAAGNCLRFALSAAPKGWRSAEAAEAALEKLPAGLP